MAGEGRFQVAAGAVIRNRSSGKVLLIHRIAQLPGGNIWEYPVGRIKQFESLEDGLRREVAEETGLTSIQIDRPIRTFAFMRGDHAAENEVRAVVFAVAADQEAITLSEEHDDYKWLTIDEAIGLAEHPGVKRDLQTYRDMYADK